MRNWSGAVRNYRSPRPRGARKRQRVILADVFPGSMPLLTLWLQTPGFQNYESINLCCANLPSSWSFCRATQGNEHNKHSTQYVLHSSLPVVGGKYWATQRNCRTSVPSWNVWKFRGDVVLKKKKSFNLYLLLLNLSKIHNKAWCIKNWSMESWFKKKAGFPSLAPDSITIINYRPKTQQSKQKKGWGEARRQAREQVY